MYREPGLRTGEGWTLPSVAPPSLPQEASLATRQANRPPQSESDSASGPGQEQSWRVEGVYIISVAARLLDLHPQTLRKYERLGLISPGRTLGMLRLYSQDDLRKVRLIQHLVGELGFNLAGVEFTLSLVDNLARLQSRLIAAAEGSPLEGAVEQEIAQLFQNLNLPVRE